jgi:DNA-binding transcriptional LysR family regulator
VNISAINLNLLVAFDALLREQSVTRAAQRVGITQAAMSNTLAQLRMLFDDQLFIRGARGVTPTARALELAGPIQSGLLLLESAFAANTFDPMRSKRSFVLATSDYCEHVVLPVLLRQLTKQAPNVRIEVRPWGLHEVPAALSSGEVDLMLGFYDELPPKHLENVLFEERFVCIVRKGHPRVNKRLTLSTYLELPHILVSQRPLSPGAVDRALAKRGLTRNVALRVSNALIVPFLVAQTDFVAAVSERIAKAFQRALPIRLFPPPLELGRSRIKQAWHSRVDSDPGHRWLRETLVDVCRRV